jgi:hypothetical protein
MRYAWSAISMVAKQLSRIFLFDICELRSPRRKEERIPLTVLLPTIRIIFRRIKVLPHAHGIDVLVLLIPPTVHNFEQSRIAVETFQFGVGDSSVLVFFELVGCQETAFRLGRHWQRSVGGWDEMCWRCCCRLRGEREEDAVVAGGGVED